MKPHSWEVEEVDGGPVGCDDFWICRACGASGGPVWYTEKGREDPPSMGAFLAGPALSLPEDCDEAARIIKDYVESDTH